MVLSPLLFAVTLVTSSPAGAAPTDTPSSLESSAETGAAPGAAVPRRALQRVVIMDLEASGGVDAAFARIVADNLVAEIRKLEGLSVVGMAEVRTMLAAEADRELVGCAEGVSCLAEIADALGADILISGSLSRLQGTTSISLRRIAQASASVAGGFEQRVGEDVDGALAAIGPAVQTLFPETSLRPGATRGVPEKLSLILHPPPIPVWATVTTGTFAGVGLLVGAGLGVGAEVARQATQATIDGSKTAAVDGSSVVAGIATTEGLALGANVALGTAVVVAGAAGLMSLFTDWDDAAGARERLLSGDAL